MPKLKKYNVYLMTPYASWENVKADNQAAAIAECEIPSFEPDPYIGPTSYLVIEIETVAEGEECPYCEEDRVDWLIWDERTMEVECQSCKRVY